MRIYIHMCVVYIGEKKKEERTHIQPRWGKCNAMLSQAKSAERHGRRMPGLPMKTKSKAHN